MYARFRRINSALEVDVYEFPMWRIRNVGGSLPRRIPGLIDAPVAAYTDPCGEVF